MVEFPAIDVRAELEQYDWINARWSSDRLIAASPFRYERQPSFFVNLDEDSEFYGCWGDSGAVDDEYASGNFPKLLAYLRRETVGETIEYLRMLYDPGPPADDELPVLRLPTLSLPERYKPLTSSILDEYWTVGSVPYLNQRGIHIRVQQLMRVGYDRKSGAVVLPWFNADGSLGNVMYRSTRSKAFWYHAEGRPIREMLYGLDVVYQRKIKRAAIVEAPIDAMTIMSAGTMAIATGGTAFGRQKAELIRKSPLEEVIVIRDNDRAGRAWQRRVIAALSGYVDVKIAAVPAYVKDVNDAGADAISRRIPKSRRIRAITHRLRPE